MSEQKVKCNVSFRHDIIKAINQEVEVESYVLLVGKNRTYDL